jgi:DMSO/TMAO reductase YedYZ molybdopterin-dependent catalytic subunit
MSSNIEIRGLVAREGTVDVSAMPGMPDVAFADVLDASGLSDDATHATVISRDGSYTASIPLEELLSGGRLTVGEDLRLTIVGGRTLCWNVKDVGSVRVTDQPEPDSVPEDPPH